MTGTSPNMTADEMFESLTGYDEIAIAQCFGGEWQELLRTKPIMFRRALAFIHFKRDGKNIQEAKNAAMDLSVGEAKGFFAEDEDEPMPDDPITESGKDD